ncbi:hypothetical protein L1987_08118 [Smallanthus sonchifolius]|uniref:Uncharacterized protein n=1 Tax=Smallanthus sonchifolius TaxID=185202 RepID=A0ACB9JLD8_9ASTR|nr:hypothetical protein L1987_08118 [Smallanthus sonchifolius]
MFNTIGENNALKQDTCFRSQRDRVIDDGCAQSTTRLRYMSLESSPTTQLQLHNYRYSVTTISNDFRELIYSLRAVLNLFSKNMSTTVENFQLVLDSHRWVPQLAVGFSSNSFGEESQEDVTPPPNLMEYPPLVVFINGVSPAMNELRPNAPISLKHKLAQELVKGLQTVSDSLLRYNTSKVLRENESVLFQSLCRAFIELGHASDIISH